MGYKIEGLPGSGSVIAADMVIWRAYTTRSSSSLVIRSKQNGWIVFPPGPDGPHHYSEVEAMAVWEPLFPCGDVTITIDGALGAGGESS